MMPVILFEPADLLSIRRRFGEAWKGLEENGFRRMMNIFEFIVEDDGQK